MSLIKGIYAASMSVLNDDLTLNVQKTIKHAEMVIDNGCHGAAIFGSTGQAQLLFYQVFYHFSTTRNLT